MKRKSWSYSVLLLALAGALAVGCQPDDEESDLLTLLLQSSGLRDAGNGTVVQNISGTDYTWLKCAQGQAWNAALNDCGGTGGGTTFGAQSLAFCQVLTGNYGDCSSLDAVNPVATSGAAFNSCAGTTFAGLTGWRLPSKGELAALAALQTRASFLLVFPQTPDDKHFWSGSGNPDKADGSEAFTVSFAEGTMGTENTVAKDAVHYVRCIRP